MRATLKHNGQTVVAPRALERQALHELDDGRLVLEHLSGDPQAFGTLVDRYDRATVGERRLGRIRAKRSDHVAHASGRRGRT